MIMHAMSVHAGEVDEIMFVSRDRFSCVFVELASLGFCFDVSKTKISHASNLVEMKKMLE